MNSCLSRVRNAAITLFIVGSQTLWSQEADQTSSPEIRRDFVKVDLKSSPELQQWASEQRIVSLEQHRENGHTRNNIAEVLNEDGSISQRVWTDLSNGMHRKDAQGNWIASSDELELLEDGAVGRQTAHQTHFSPETGRPSSVTIATEESGRIGVTFLGVSYYDMATGKSVLIAPAKTARGFQTSRNQITYSDAMDGLKGDLRYTHRINGLASDLILNERPAPPHEYGLSDQSSVIEVISEWFPERQPVVKHADLPFEANEADKSRRLQDRDTTIEFGDLVIGFGQAFRIGDGSEDPATVEKQWSQTQDGRLVLYERLSWGELDRLTQGLPQGKAFFPENQGAWNRVPKRPTLDRWQSTPLIADYKRSPKHGVVLDYELLATVPDLTLRSDVTYLVENEVVVSGTLRLESAVIKYRPYVAGAPNNSPGITVNGSIVNLTSQWRPAVFTSVRDSSIGENIETGTISGWYGNRQLLIHNSSSSTQLENLRFKHGWIGIAIYNNLGGSIRHCQFVSCHIGIESFQSFIRVENILVHGVTGDGSSSGVTVAANASSYSEVYGAHGTFRNLNRAITLSATGINSAVFPNSIFSGIGFTNNISGAGSVIIPGSGAFQTNGLGHHYLVDGSPYRDVGTTNLSGELLRDLATRTTYPPAALSSLYTTTVLTPHAGRDADIPDLGYHYDPIDYIASGIDLDAATLIVTNGVTIASHGTYGIQIVNNSKLYSTGRPERLNRFVRRNLVQEMAEFVSPAPDCQIKIGSQMGSGYVIFNFTDFPALSGTLDSREALDMGAGNAISILEFRNCQFRGCRIRGYSDDTGYPTLLNLDNNLGDRANIFVTETSDSAKLTVGIRNCTFNGGTNNLNHKSLNTWTVQNNVFDNCKLEVTGSSPMTLGYNGFVNYTNSAWYSGLNSGSGNVTLSSFVFSAGPCHGAYHVGTNFKNVGTGTASSRGLFHQTALRDEVSDGNTTVDLGGHAVSTAIAGDYVGHWDFDEIVGATALSDSPVTLNGTLGTGATRVAGKYRGGIHFNGLATAAVTVNDNAAIKLSTALTISFWIRKSAEQPGWSGILAKGTTTTRNYAVLDNTDGDKRISFETRNATTTQSIASTTSLHHGTWYHVACVFTGTSGFIYVDGKLDAQATGWQGPLLTSTDPLLIGRADTYANSMRGALDDVRIYNRALTATEILVIATPRMRDTDGDSLPDYFEDANGNGVLSSAETSINDANDSGFRVYLGRPATSGILP